MAKRLEQKLAQISALRKGEPNAAAIKILASILAKDEGAAVARVADLVVEWALFEQQPLLVKAFERLLEGGSDIDPQCWGKIALVKALQALGWHDPEVFRLGCRCVQMEPVWGGQEDSAPALRAQSALALSGCPGIPYDQAINELVRLLADPSWNVRVGAALAVANLGYPQGAPLLRLRALLGDSEPRVIGACLEGLLHLSQIEAVPFIQEFLNHPDAAIRLEAHCVLAASSLTEAVGLAKSELETLTNPRARKAVMAALASSPSPSALDFLLGLLSRGGRSKTLAALEVLHPRLQQREFYERTLAAIAQNPDPNLRAELESHL